MKRDLIEIEAFCQCNEYCFGCPYEDECFESYWMFGCMHHRDWMEHFTEIFYAEGEL